MQIQLKQAEIVTALKMYIVSQGIILANKEVSISFTAGRKEAGVLADISIEDAVASTCVEAPTEAVPVPPAAPAAVAEAEAPVAEPNAVTVAAMEEAREMSVADEPPFATATEAPAVKASSLFS